MRTTGAGASQTDGWTDTSNVQAARHTPSARGTSTSVPVPVIVATPVALENATFHTTLAGRSVVTSDCVFVSMQSSPPEYSSSRTTLSLPSTTPESRNVKFEQVADAATSPADGP